MQVVRLRYAAVVLAAGKSQRMGRNKLLLEVSGRTLLDHVLDALERSGVDEIFVVLGHKPDDLKPIVESHKAKIVINLNYEEGMTSSIKAGFRDVKADATFIVLGDQLGLEAKLLKRMSELMTTNLDILIVSPIFEGKRGHPILVRRNLFPEIMALNKAQSLKDVVLRHEMQHGLVEGAVWSVTDIDTAEDFDKAKKLWLSSKNDQTIFFK